MLTVKTIVVGLYEENCYLLIDSKSKEVLIFDPGAEVDKITHFIEQEQLVPKGLLLTHGHGDHIGAVRDILEKYEIPLYAGKEEAPMLADANLNLSAALGLNITTPKPEFLLDDGQQIEISGFSLKVIATPGHSPGGVCYYAESDSILFTGDTLFYGSIGRTDFPGCSTSQLLSSIKRHPLRPSYLVSICHQGLVIPLSRLRFASIHLP